MGEEGQKKKKVLVEHNKADIRRGSDDEITLPILFLRFFFFFFFFLSSAFICVCCVPVCPLFFFFTNLLLLPDFTRLLFRMCACVFFFFLSMRHRFSVSFSSPHLPFLFFVCLFFLSWLIPSSFLSLLFRLAPPSLLEYVVQWLSPSSAYHTASWLAFVLFFLTVFFVELLGTSLIRAGIQLCGFWRW